MLLLLLAHADIFFDETLWRLRNFVGPQKTMLALLKWKWYHNLEESDDHLNIAGEGFFRNNNNNNTNSRHDFQLHLRSNSQDAWIFRSPILDQDLLEASSFFLGAPRCDNRIAALFRDHNYSVINPAFAIRAIEVSYFGRQTTLYDIHAAVRGRGEEVFISDAFEI